MLDDFKVDSNFLKAYQGAINGDNIPRWIAKRKLKGITQEAIAKDIGVRQTTISSFERGLSRNVKIIAYYYNKFGGE